MRKKPAKRINYYRIALQWAILLLLSYMTVRPFVQKSYAADFEAYCPFGGLQALAGYFSTNSLACSMTTVQIALGFFLLLAVVLFAKLFCSYLCPIGTVTEWIGSRARKLKLQISLKGWPDRLLRLLKYALLFITFYFPISSSELFCRKFDPYYASFTGFSGDVILYFAIPALLLTLVGSFFIRQFWCKYLCPLGAITNLAVYALPAAALTLLWVILNSVFNLQVSWVWLAAALCLAGFVLEAGSLRFLVFPGLRVTRNKEICSSCRICDKKCPMAIGISTVAKVDHIDCHLCTDCIVKCPEKGALTLNRRPWPWLPATVTVLLISLALLISSRYEIPTISERYADAQSIRTAGIFEMSGLKNIKCFGSSRAFANQMKEVPGVLGVETFVKHHAVKVYFDPKLTTAGKIKSAIFSPLALYFKAPASNLSRISSIRLGIDRCFDPNDQNLLSGLVMGHKGILAMETSFGEPVNATFYYDSTAANPAEIIACIEQKSLFLGEGAEKTELMTDFAVNSRGRITGSLDKESFLSGLLAATDASFNHADSYKAADLKIYELPFKAGAEPEMQQWIPYLLSHASNNDGIVRFKIVFTAKDPRLRLWFVPKLTRPEEIQQLMNEPVFLVHYPDKSVEKVKNPFSFKEEGKTFPAE